jgi:hypothetical protein
MADNPIIVGSLIYSHIIPPILAFLGVILLCNGIMDRDSRFTLAGIVIFLMAGILPFLILPLVIG